MNESVSSSKRKIEFTPILVRNVSAFEELERTLP